MTKDKSKICRSFRQDFPEFVARAEALGVSINLSEGRRNGRERVFWLDGCRQLTGYTTRSDGGRFTHADAVANIERALAAIEEGRAIIAGLTVAERFARDEIGSVWIYDERPDIGTALWKLGCLCLEVTGLFAAFDPGNKPWNESLISRPDGV